MWRVFWTWVSRVLLFKQPDSINDIEVAKQNRIKEILPALFIYFKL
jgi:hypothetical protein